MHGVCLDALFPPARPEPRDLAFTGLDGARLVARHDRRFYRYADELHDSGFEVAAALARESFNTSNYDSAAVRREVVQYARALGESVDYWIIGNEMDAGLLPKESPSSWKMTPTEYARFFDRCVDGILSVDPAALIVLGGLVSGQPAALGEYLAALGSTRQWVHGYDVHPYAKRLVAAAELLEAYQLQAPNLNAYVFEWNRPSDEIEGFKKMLGSRLVDVAGWAWAMWSDAQAPEPMGLVDVNGWPKEEARAMGRVL